MRFYLGKKSGFCVEIDGAVHPLSKWRLFHDKEIIYFEKAWKKAELNGWWSRVEYPETLLTHPLEIVRRIAKKYLEGEEAWIKRFIKSISYENIFGENIFRKKRP